MKKQFQISSAVYKMIKSEALKLPEMHVLGKDGKPLRRIKTHVNFTKFDEVKKKIHTNYNKETEPIIVNHENEMVLAYKATGQAGIDIYIEMVTKIDRQSVPMRFMKSLMALKGIDADVVGYSKEWIETLAPTLNGFFDKNPDKYKDMVIATIIKSITEGLTPDEATNHLKNSYDGLAAVEEALIEFDNYLDEQI